MRTLLPLAALVVFASCRTSKDLRFFIEQKDDATLRHTTSGDVIGGPAHYGAVAWLGIPFAQPPVGPLRWRAPQPPTPWTEPREALHYGHACAQPSTPLLGEGEREGQVAGDEDCLTLNVFAPPKAEKLPVMFWIHGGGNSIGSASIYDGGRLATTQGVVVITTQYRLGPLGWFRHRGLRAESSDATEQSGNFGTLDLIRALEWVRDNAEAFGGDPGNVTVFGESAGGFDVYSLLVAKNAKGLFHRAIIESGALFSSTPDQAEAFADDEPKGAKHSSNETLASLLIHDGKAADRASAKALIASMSDAQIAEYLRAKPVGELLEQYKGGLAGMLDAPLVFRDGAVLPKEEIVEALGEPGGWNQVPVITGTNRDEYKLFEFLDPKRVWKLFGLLPRYRNEPTYQVAADAVSRAWRAAAVDAPAEAMVRSGAKDIYSYRFDWSQEESLLGTDLKGMVGAAHGIEIPFVFGVFSGGPTKRLFGDGPQPERTALSDAMMAWWGTFAHTGKPDRGGGALPQWTPWDPSSPHAMKEMILDVPEGGGTRMAARTENVEQIVMDVRSDARLKDQKSRCQVMHDLVFFRRDEAKALYALAGGEPCAAFPYDTYPWE